MKVPVPEVIPSADQLGRVHFVGIGGAGLSGIARVMLARGIPVSGSDADDSPTLAALRALGARVSLGHDAANVHDVDTLVVSVAVRDDNPEVAEARRQGLVVLPRSAAVASVMVGRRALAVAGTHGKTTTTSLLTVALQAAGADPSYAVGGDLAQTGTNAAEVPATCSWSRPTRATARSSSTGRTRRSVTNVEADHLDQWGSEEAYRAGFDRVRGPDRAGRLPGLLRRRRRGGSAGRCRAQPRAGGVRRRRGRERRRPLRRPGVRGRDIGVHGGRRRRRAGPRDAADPRPALRARCARRAHRRPAPGLRVRRPASRSRGLHRHSPADGAQG